MIDAPGPWGTGPFELVSGTSTITERDDEVVMVPNENYWNPARKPTVRIIYDNAISKADAIQSVADGAGIDVVFDVTTDEAHAFSSDEGKIQRKAAKTVLAGVFNGNKPNSPWNDLEVRKAANMAVDRDRVLKDGAYGYGTIMPAFIAPGRYGQDSSMKPYAFEPDKAKAVFETKGVKTIVIVASPSFEKVADEIAADFNEAGVEAKAVITRDDPPDDWDIKLEWYFDWSPQYPVGVVHREFFGKGGILRMSPEEAKFDALYDKLLHTTKQPEQENVVKETEHFVFDNAMCLFLYAPDRLFAVSNRTDFTPYETCMSELAETKIKG